MKELFNVRKIDGNKIVAGPFETKKAAKAARNDLDPEVSGLPPTERSNKFSFVVTFGKDHLNYGRKQRSQQSSAYGKKSKPKK